MKKITNYLWVWVLLSVGVVSCSDSDDNRLERLSVAAFYPAIVMEGTEVTITGTALDQVIEVVFPGDVSATSLQVVDARTLKVTTPAGVSETPASLIVRGEGLEAESRQSIRKAFPVFNYFNPAQTAKTHENLLVVGEDLLLVDAIHFDNGEKQSVVRALDFVRKSNTQLNLLLPPATPTGNEVTLSAVFKNGEILPLGALSIEEGESSGGSWVEKEVVLYGGDPVEMGGWSGSITNIKAAAFADAKLNDVIRVYITDAVEGYQQGSLKNGDTWGGLTDELGVIDLSENDFAIGYYQGTIADEDILGQLRESGLIVSGCNYTATKVSLFTSVWVDDEEGSQTDPVTDQTIMLNDFEDDGSHNSDWDGSWTNSEATEFLTDNNGNVYLRMKEELDGWIINCNHIDRDSVKSIENYYVKLDVLVEEGVEGASKAAMQFIIADNWCWVGEGMFPESTNGKWVTIRFDASQWFSGDLEIGTITNGLYGGVLPAGVCIDNFRLDPK